MNLGCLLVNVRDLMLIRFPRSGYNMYFINKTIKVYNEVSDDNLEWKVRSIHRTKRRDLTIKEKEAMYSLCQQLRTIEYHPKLHYYINQICNQVFSN